MNLPFPGDGLSHPNRAYEPPLSFPEVASSGPGLGKCQWETQSAPRRELSCHSHGNGQLSFGTFIFAQSGVQSKCPERCERPRSPSLPGCLRCHPPSPSFLGLISPLPPISFPSFFTSVYAFSARDAFRYGSFLQETSVLVRPQPAELGSWTAGPGAGKRGGRSR